MENDPEEEKAFEVQMLLQLTQEMTESEVRRIISYAETLKTLRIHVPS